MEKRFGIKDLLLLLMLGVLIVVVLLAMKQYDRQWQVLAQIQKQGAEQNQALAAIRRAVQSGAFVARAPAPAAAASGSTTSPTTNAASASGEGIDPFRHVKEAQQKPDYALGDWFVDNFPAQVAKLTPLLATDLYQRVVEYRVMESLVTYDPETLETMPLLARSWQVSPDGLSVTFRLREGVTFSDGQPFTADDVVFTFDWIMNPKVAAPRERSTLERLKSVTKDGDYEVTFKFSEPYYLIVETVGTMSIMAKHFYGKYTPEQFNQQLGLLIGTGPYKLQDPESWRPGTKIVLYRNDSYWGEPPPFNRIIYNEVIEEVAALTMFRNGEIDRLTTLPDQHVAMLKDPQLVARTQHFEFLPPTGGYMYTAWNQKYKGQPTPFADKRVRQAMTMLIDRERIVNEVLMGLGVVANGPFEPGSDQADPAIKPWPYNPEAARALLTQAGFRDRDGDGVIEGPDGKPFRFTYTYSSGIKLYERAVFLIKDALAKVGIVVDLDPQEWPIIVTKLTNRDFQVISLRWGGGDPEGDIRQMFHSSQIADNGDNFMSYVNPKLDEVIDRARSTIDKQKRMELWHECHRILHEDQPYTFLFCQKYMYWFDGRIQNIHEAKLGLNQFHYHIAPIPWYVPAARQKYKQ
jgi:peptide/nickel transport system substrate-binding protein